MGMSNLDCLGEIAECIKASSATLNSLSLSLSTDLARKARKPTPVNPELDDASDTELEEDDMLDPMPPPPSTAQPATNEADIRKEKLAQESILAKVFDLQSVSAEGRKLEKSLSLAGGQCLEEEDRQAASEKIKALLKSVFDDPSTSDNASLTRLEQFKVVRDVADMYISKQNALKKSLKEQSKPTKPPIKKKESAAKQPMPPPSGFEPSSSSSQVLSIPNDWDLGHLSSPSNPLFESAMAAMSNDFFNGLPKPLGSSFSTDFAGSSNKDKAASVQAQVQALKAQHAQLQAAQSQSQAYMSPYLSVPLSNPPSGNTLVPVPYENSHPSSPGSHDGLSSASLYNTYHQGSNNPLSPPYDFIEDPIFPNITNGISTATKKAKSKAPVKKQVSATKAASGIDSEDESDTPLKNPPSTEQPFFAADPGTEPAEESMDIDMVHPDEDMADLGEDQEIMAEAEEVEVATPRKKAKIGDMEQGSSSKAERNEPSSSKQVDAVPEPETKIPDPIPPDEAMQAYIRATHGLHLEELSLEWVPLKASIVARALDLSVLKRVQFLEVGSQDAFWTLLVRLQSSSPTDIAFKSIHTDNISLPFVKFLATFEGLEELYMHERSGKQEADVGTAPVVSITVIRKMALKKHMSTLKRLMIRNERNDTWDIDAKTLQFLAYKGQGLVELACSLNMKTYVSLYHFSNVYDTKVISTCSCNSLLASNISMPYILSIYAPRTATRYCKANVSASLSTALLIAQR